MSRPSRPHYTKAELREAIAASRSINEVLRRFELRTAGGNHRTIRRHAETWGISMDHFDPRVAQREAGRRKAKPLSEILVAESTYSRGALKRRLYQEGLKKPRCELCGQNESWRGRRMAMILDHVNGNPTDNRLENLQVVCPNCAATLETHCGRNKPAAPRECATCGNAFRPNAAAQRYCSTACSGRAPGRRRPQPHSRKVERPPYDVLLAELAASSFSAVGRKYGVSGNAVRKWVRWYERERSDEAA